MTPGPASPTIGVSRDDGGRAMAEWKVALFFYTVISALTLVYQLWIELPQCEWFGGCLLSFSEAIVLAVIWPLYWPLYFGWL